MPTTPPAWTCAAEALWLSRLLDRLMAGLVPDEPEVTGLLALMLLNEARMPARGPAGRVVLLKDQDRSLWDHALIGEGQELVLACLRRRRLGPFQLQAAIQALHCAAPTYAETDWTAIVRFYDRLYPLMPTPVVAMNRSVAGGDNPRTGDWPGAARGGGGGARRLPPAACRSRIDADQAGANSRSRPGIRPRSCSCEDRRRGLIPQPAPKRANCRPWGRACRLGVLWVGCRHRSTLCHRWMRLSARHSM